MIDANSKPADFSKTGRKSYYQWCKGTWCFPFPTFPQSNCCNHSRLSRENPSVIRGDCFRKKKKEMNELFHSWKKQLGKGNRRLAAVWNVPPVQRESVEVNALSQKEPEKPLHLCLHGPPHKPGSRRHYSAWGAHLFILLSPIKKILLFKKWKGVYKWKNKFESSFLTASTWGIPKSKLISHRLSDSFQPWTILNRR